MHNNNRISLNQPDFHISVILSHTLDDDKTEISPLSLLEPQLISSVHFSFSGTIDRSNPISPKEMLSSSVVQSFRRYLKINEEHLGIIDISEVFLENPSSGTSGIPKVFVTPAPCPGRRASPHAHVLSIHLAYNWKPFSQLSSGLSIFSPQTLLPLQPALNKLMKKLFSVHVVGRYPWLFGPLRTKFHLEHQWFPSVVRSLLAITDRSEDLIFRNKIQALVKAEATVPSICLETEHYPQEIKYRVSAYGQITGSCLSSCCMSRKSPSDSPAVDTSDTLILALELVLRVAARPPPFKGACLHTASTQSSSDDEIFGLSGSHHPSQDFSSDTLSWDDPFPVNLCLFSEPWINLFDGNIRSGDVKDIIVGNSKPDSLCQFPPSEGAGLTTSDRPLTSRSNWDSSVDEEESMSCDSPPLASEPWAGMSGLRCPASHENFIVLDYNLDASPDLCIFDEDVDGDAAMLLALD